MVFCNYTYLLEFYGKQKGPMSQTILAALRAISETKRECLKLDLSLVLIVKRSSVYISLVGKEQ